MKRKLLILLTVFSMCCLVACGGEKTNDTNAGGNIDDAPVVTAEPTTEVTPAPVDEYETTPAPTEEPVEEATPAPTEEPSVVYEGIDMEYSHIL